MPKFLTDENFRQVILDEVLKKNSSIDFIRVQDVGLEATDDPIILEWAAQAERIVITHDIRTMPRYAYERIRAGKRMPGLFALRDTLPVGIAIAEILMVAEYSLDNEWDNRVEFLPL